MKALIAVLPGDGVGPEVVREAVKVLKVVALKFGHSFEYQEALLGGAAIDQTGFSLPEETLSLCQVASAVLMGAVGGPKWDSAGKNRPELGLLSLRSGLSLYANLRPVKPHPELLDASPIKASVLRGTDLLVVRELMSGIYFGEKRRGADRASDVCSYTTKEIEQIVRTAGALAQKRRRKLTSVDKANVLETSRLWREVTERVIRQEFPDVALEHLLVDNCAMQLIRRPADFDVLVTENMFGDILTDEASVLAGSIGMLPSASLGEGKKGLYEPIHGTAPDIAGKGIANPVGTILSAALLLRHSLSLEVEANAVEDAVSAALSSGVLTADLLPSGAQAATTSQVGDAVVRHLSPTS